MTPEQAKQLKEDDRVKWWNGDLGTVREISYAAVRVEWDDRVQTLFTFQDIEPLKSLSRALGKTRS